VTCTAITGTTSTIISYINYPSWIDAPNWNNLAGDTYSSISVQAQAPADTENCRGQTAICSGTFTVQTGVISGTPVEFIGENYETVVIGTQTWMARNLNLDVGGSVCYDNVPANCEKYGRLYNWATAMDLDPTCNSKSCASQIKAKHQGICPNGWHLPSVGEWGVLMEFVNPKCFHNTASNSTCDGAGIKLKAKSDDWNNDYIGIYGEGTDDFGFSALPGGQHYLYGSFINVGLHGYWWSASETGIQAYLRSMYYKSDGVIYDLEDKSNLFSVRCLQD